MTIDPREIPLGQIFRANMGGETGKNLVMIKIPYHSKWENSDEFVLQPIDARAARRGHFWSNPTLPIKDYEPLTVDWDSLPAPQAEQPEEPDPPAVDPDEVRSAWGV